MKFSYRIAATCVFSLVLLLLYFTWDDLHWNWQTQASHKAKLIDSHVWPLRMSTVPKPVIKDLGECEFSKTKGAEVDIDTFNILEEIEREAKGGKHKSEMKTFRKRNRPLKIILVPHSHNDPGWTKTLDEYFHDQTKLTLDNMVEKLLKYPKMTFIWAESVFLSMWWKDLDETAKDNVRKLVRNRQLEILIGSWVVPDEANPHYYALVDQMIEGHQWLEKNIGVKPNNTWSLDPFGYSSTLPYLYKKAGFQNMVILRVHEQVKNHLIDKQALEFYWRQHWDTAGSTDIRTQMMPYKLYNIKHTCGPDHYTCLMFDFRKIPGEDSEARAEPVTTNNVDRLSKLLLGQYQKKADLFRHNVVLVPLGDDFRYDRNVEWDQQFKNYMMLFNYINAKKEWNVQARFGTIQDYFDELDKEIHLAAEDNKPLSFPTLSGDFFPYTDERDEYWTGYFTSRPYDKVVGRELENHIRAAEILNTLANAVASVKKVTFTEYEDNLVMMQSAHESLGLFQHHDAITGTARSFVVQDYERRVRDALHKSQEVIKSASERLLRGPNEQSQRIVIDIDDEFSLKPTKEDPKFLDFSRNTAAEVLFFNPIAQKRRQLVLLQTSSYKLKVQDNEGNIIPAQINPVWIGDDKISSKRYELLFFADLPPLGLRSYVILHQASESTSFALVMLQNAKNYVVPRNIPFQVLPPGIETVVLENESYRARFSQRTGFLQSVTTKNKIQTTKMFIQFMMYKSRGSGAYIFNPVGPPVDSEFAERPVVRVMKGPLVSEIHSVQKLVKHMVRLINTTGPLSDAIEINNIVDILSMEDKELVMLIKSDIKNVNNTYFTDLNGFHAIKRKHFLGFPTSANYYPMSSMVYLEDFNSRLTLLTAQPLGTTHPDTGTIEVMLDRRLSYDDGRGLGEGIYDNKLTPSRFYLILERLLPSTPNSLPKENPDGKPGIAYPSLLVNVLANHLNRPVFNMFVKNASKSETSLPTFSPLAYPLPCDVIMLSLRSVYSPDVRAPPTGGLVLHRQAFDCSYMSNSLQCTTNSGNIQLGSLFSVVKVGEIYETTLSLMHEKRTLNRKDTIKLDPMELYTYKLTFQ